MNKVLCTLTAAAIVAVAVVATRFLHRSKYQPKFDDKLDDTPFQGIKEFNMADLLYWVSNNLPESFSKGKIRILPPGESNNLLKGAKLSEANKKKAVYFDVVDENDNVLIKKFVLPLSISDDLSPIKEGKVYNIPLES